MISVANIRKEENQACIMFPSTPLRERIDFRFKNYSVAERGRSHIERELPITPFYSN